MKNLSKFLFVFLAVAVVATSCNDDDDLGLAPVISNLEVGGHHDHDHKLATKAEEEVHVGHIGEDLHVAADIEAANKVAKVVISIHEEGNHHDHATKVETTEFELNEEYTDLAGQRNGKFHHHIDIPATAEPGHYHFHFKVIDQAGLTTEKEVELHLEIEEK